MTADLVLRLRAALDGHERKARAAAAETGADWCASDPGLYVADDPRQPGAFATGCWGDLDEQVAAHMAANDPAHVLRTVQAHREILARYESAVVARDAAVDTLLAGATRLSLRIHEETVRLIAAVYLPVPDTKEDPKNDH